jgi:HD-like signal output (HDOD) protein
MQASMIQGTGLEEIASTKLNGVLYHSRHFDTDPRLAGIVNNSLAENNDLPPNIDNLVNGMGNRLNNPDAIDELVALNPALAAKVLRLVNTSFAALRGKISSLKRATKVLGPKHIGALLQSSSAFMKHKHHKLPPTLPLGKLWQHSFAVSRIAEVIADGVGNLDGATLKAAGLLHDTGKLVLAAINPEKFATCLNIASENGHSLIEAELEILGVTHPLLSGALGKRWNLPDRLWNIMVYQSQMEYAPDPKMAAALALAEFIARTFELGCDGEHTDRTVIDRAVRILDIPVEKAPRLVDNIEMDRIKQTCRIMADWE